MTDQTPPAMVPNLADVRWRGRIKQAGGHRLVRQFIRLCNERRVLFKEVAKTSGVGAATMRSWKRDCDPSVKKLDAALNAIGYRLTVERLDG